MNKSTPINQLPSNLPNQQNAFVNDQQRQMITQAQAAIGNSTMPQNTQLPNEILNEDDAVIQDMLNNLNTGQSNSSVDPGYTQEDLLRLAAMNNLNINQFPQQQYAPAQNYGYMSTVQTSQPTSYAKQFTAILTSEFKLAAVVFFLVIIVQLVPFHSYLAKYIAIDKVPYHDVILRAIIAALAVIIIKKLM